MCENLYEGQLRACLHQDGTELFCVRSVGCHFDMIIMASKYFLRLLHMRIFIDPRWEPSRSNSPSDQALTWGMIIRALVTIHQIEAT